MAEMVEPPLLRTSLDLERWGRAGLKLNQAWAYPGALFMGFSILRKTTADNPGSPRRADHHEATLVGPLCARAPAPPPHQGMHQAQDGRCRELN